MLPRLQWYTLLALTTQRMYLPFFNILLCTSSKTQESSIDITIMMFYALLLVLVGIHGTFGGHFRGGSMSWKKMPDTDQVRS